jgi:LytS/YehU family sensor histidine kinase
VNQRIKLVFGEEYGAVISCGETAGAAVELVFPAVRNQNPDNEYI